MWVLHIVNDSKLRIMVANSLIEILQLIETCKESKTQIKNAINWLTEGSDSELSKFITCIINSTNAVCTEYSKDRFNKLGNDSGSKDTINVVII